MFVVSMRRPLIGAAFFISVAMAFCRAQDGDLAGQSHQARELMAARRFEEAIPIYERLVKAIPGNPGLLLNLALAEEMAGHPARAIPYFESVLKAQPDSVPALISLSMARLQLNQPREAIAPLKKLIALDPGNRNALGMLADAELSQNLFSEAAGHYRELTASDDKDPQAWYGLGKAYESLTTRTFDQLNKAAPQSPYIAALLADSRLQRRQYRSAFFFYHQARSKLPDLPGIHAGLALVYRGTDHADWAAAEEKRERALPAPDCKRQPAACAFLAGRFAEAIQAAKPDPSAANLFWATRAYNQLAAEAFDHLSQLPESVQIHALKAQTFRDHKQPAEAVAEWRAALKLSPDDKKVKHELAAALFEAKEYQAAIPIMQELLPNEPNSADLPYMIGASLWYTEQPEKALPYLESAVQARSAVPAAGALLGLVLAGLNKSAEAIPYLKKALPLDDDGSLHYSLSRAYQAAGNAPMAAEALKQYRQIQQRNQQINDELAKEAEISAPQ